GVTSLRTGGSIEPHTHIELKKTIDPGKSGGPKIHITGPYLEGLPPPIPQPHRISHAKEAAKMVAFLARAGGTRVKAYNVITRAELKAAIDEAHRRHLKLTGHLCSVGFREAADLNIDDLEHGLLVDTEFFPDKKPDQCPDPTKAILHLSSMEVAGPE